MREIEDEMDGALASGAGYIPFALYGGSFLKRKMREENDRQNYYRYQPSGHGSHSRCTVSYLSRMGTVCRKSVRDRNLQCLEHNLNSSLQ